MNLTVTNSLTEAELALVRETDRDRLAGLDEDALAELHDRIRRARTKYPPFTVVEPPSQRPRTTV